MFVANYYQSNVPYDVILILKKSFINTVCTCGTDKDYGTIKSRQRQTWAQKRESFIYLRSLW